MQSHKPVNLKLCYNEQPRIFVLFIKTAALQVTNYDQNNFGISVEEFNFNKAAPLRPLWLITKY